jgi:hypothetical protein
MTMRIRSLALLATALTIPCAASAGIFPAIPKGEMKGYFVVPHHDWGNAPTRAPSGSDLTQWNGSFTDQTGKKITFTHIGTDPGSTNTSTTTTVLIIPIKMVYGASNGNMTFNPKKHKVANDGNNNVLQSMLASPLFQSGVDFNVGGTDLGTTQYIDAFQRGNFWNANVKNESGYHVLLTAKMEKQQTINVSPSQGSVITSNFGHHPKVGTMDINAFDAALQTFMAKLKDVNPGVLPLFVTYNVYLTSGGCCIGGYHNANGAQPGGQTYSYATFVDDPTSFSQDVSAFSHEIGEWQDDPFVDNHVNCSDNSIMEVGDPLEREANYGGYPYTLNGYTYNLQSLSFIDYFGDSTSIPVNSQWSFQGSKDTAAQHFCPGQ